MSLWLFSNCFLRVFQAIVFFIHSLFLILRKHLKKEKREIEIVKAGKKNLMYPDNVTGCLQIKSGKVFRSTSEVKGYCFKDSGRRNYCGSERDDDRPSRLSFMEKGKVPCLWILGSMDNYIPCDVIQKKIRLPANAKVVILKNSGHMGFVEEEENSVEVITEFVERLSWILIFHSSYLIAHIS